MIAIILRIFRDRWKTLLLLCLIGVGTMLMYISMYPTYQKLLSQNQQIYQQMPEALKKAFNMDTFTFDTLEKFLNIEMYSLFWIVLTVILTLSLSSTALAGEIERETIVQTLTQPISRSGVYIAKFLAAAKLFTIFNVLVNASALPLAAVFHLSLDAGHVVVVSVMCELFGLALLGVGFAVSAFMSDKGKTQMILAGTILVTYTLNIVSALLPSLDKWKYLSFFHYFNPSTFLVKGKYDLNSVWYYSGLIIVGFLLGWWRFTKRDVA